MQTGGEIGFTELSVAPRLPIPGSQYRSSDDALRPPSGELSRNVEFHSVILTFHSGLGRRLVRHQTI